MIHWRDLPSHSIDGHSDTIVNSGGYLIDIGKVVWIIVRDEMGQCSILNMTWPGSSIIFCTGFLDKFWLIKFDLRVSSSHWLGSKYHYHI